MDIRNRLSSMFDQTIAGEWDQLTEIRLRANKAARYRLLTGEELIGPVIDTDKLRGIVHMLMDESLYAREEELKQGYFTAAGGCRVGVCGKTNISGGGITSLGDIGSVCIRVPREMIGCADSLHRYCGCSLLILSPPGLGKTTLLRDLVRQTSNSGMNVGVCDERRELAACREGVPMMDLGERADVMDGCPKSVAIPLLIRACAPDVIAADEIGSDDDACALRDAVRCGAKILATAHASSIKDALQRRNIGMLISDGIFDHVVLLGESPGKISEIRKLTNGVEA